jgi:hypothetical protein
MSTLLEIEHAIEQLPAREQSVLAAWLAVREAKVWDEQMDADAATGKLDFLFREAETERRERHLKEWPK